MLACGGRENDLAVWDIEKQATVFSAKNVKHDKLNLRVPVWITGVQVGRCRRLGVRARGGRSTVRCLWLAVSTPSSFCPLGRRVTAVCDC